MSTLSSATARRGAILVVEDREDVRSGLAQLLEFHGFLVAEARDGETALEHLHRSEHDIALVLLDLMLPGKVSGRDIRGLMLSNPAHTDTPTIIVTAADVDAPGRAGLCPTAWLEKPFRFDELLGLVKRFVIPEVPAFAPAD